MNRPPRRILVALALGLVLGLGLLPALAGWVAGGTGRAATALAPAGDPGASPLSPMADTPRGAADFAAAVVQGLGSEQLLDAAYRHELLARNAAPDQRSTLTDRIDLEVNAMDRQMSWSADVAAGLPVLLRTAVMGERVAAFSPDRATVELWLVGVVGSDHDGVGEDWQLTTAGLTWIGPRWTLASLDTADGPVPERGPVRVSSPSEALAWAGSWPAWPGDFDLGVRRVAG